MEICTFNLLSPSHPKPPLPSYPFLSLNRFSLSRINPGCVYLFNSSVRATSSQDKSTGSSQYFLEDHVARNWCQPAVKNSNVGSETSEKEEATESTPIDEQRQTFEFLDKLDVNGSKCRMASNFSLARPFLYSLDSEDKSSVLLLGGGSLITVWIAIVLVGAIDSIPLFPKLMEAIGLAYTLWFGTRYLLFKNNREELIVKIEEIKQQVLGSNKED